LAGSLEEFPRTTTNRDGFRDPAGAPVLAFSHLGHTLLLAESGYAPTNPPEWIEKLRPQVVLLSVVAGDREERPDSEALEAMEGYSLLRTDRNGWIHLAMDGRRCGSRWKESDWKRPCYNRLIVVSKIEVIPYGYSYSPETSI